VKSIRLHYEPDVIQYYRVSTQIRKLRKEKNKRGSRTASNHSRNASFHSITAIFNVNRRGALGRSIKGDLYLGGNEGMSDRRKGRTFGRKLWHER